MYYIIKGNKYATSLSQLCKKKPKTTTEDKNPPCSSCNRWAETPERLQDSRPPASEPRPDIPEEAD